MANTIGKFIKYGKTIFDRRDSKVNFIVPENLVSYQGINGRQNDTNLELNQNNFRLQIGKMDKKDETIYTKEILLPAIEYILKKTGKSEKAVIQLRPDLAKFLTNEDQKEESKQILSFEEEKQKIIHLIKKYFKNKEKNIEIVNISKQYPEIFSLLKEKGKDGLSSAEKPLLDKEGFSQLALAKYLYRISQHNKKFMNLLYNTKTEKQKKLDTLPIGENQSDYYSLVEISIRLYEVLSGISIQGGIDRQSKYDRIIGGILEWKDVDPFKIKDYAELQELHNFCKKINPDFVFERLRISTKDAEKVGEKKQTISKFKTTSLIASVALMSVLAGGLGGYQVSNYNQKKKIDEILSDLDLLEKKDELAGNLSGGQMRLLEIARLYLQKTKLYLLDEPTAGVSPKLKSKVVELIKKIIAKDKMVIIVEHDFEFLSHFVDRFYVMDDGKIVLEGDYASIKENPITKEIYFGRGNSKESNPRILERAELVKIG